MKTQLKLFLLILYCICVFGSCKKDKNNKDPHNRDISKLSLIELKTTIAGNWKLVYSWGYYQGRVDYASTYIDFYNFSDSVKWVENNVQTVRTNATYTNVRSIYSVDSTYQIDYFARAHNAYYGWVADKIKNDTLILRDDNYSPNTYYLVK